MVSKEVVNLLTKAAITTLVPRCMVVKQKEGDFTKVSPFLTEKTITAHAGSSIKDIRKMNLGLMIKTLNDQQERVGGIG